MKHINKVALVTGSSRGLGRAIALKLAADGADIIVTYREKKDEADQVAAEIQKLGRKAAVLQIDVADTKTFETFAKTVAETLESTWQRKSFDFLVNNAGIDVWSPFDQMTEEGFDRLVNVHFKGVYFLTQKLLPYIADGGRIVNTSSGLARFSVPGYSAYGALKGAIEVLTRYMAKELGHRKISANVVAPGVVETDFTRRALSDEKMKAHLESNTALGRVGQPEDIAGVVTFLCSEEARWVNAQRVEASGGMFL